MHQNSNIHFIIGIGRSGTTILTKLLNEYQNIHCLPEANFLTFFLHRFKHKTSFTLPEIEMVFEQIQIYSLSNPWIGWDFDTEAVKKEVLDHLSVSTKITYQELCKLIYRGFEMNGVDKKEAPLLIDKNPSFTLFANQISTAFPDAKFIWMVRDYRANVFSWLQNPFLKESNVPLNAIRWMLYNEEALKFYTKHKEKTILVKYEELVLNHETEIQKIIRFLNIDPIPETNYLEKAAIDLTKFEIDSEHKNIFTKKYTDLNQPLNTNRLDSWKNGLSESQIRLCDALCSSVASEMGYKPMHDVTPTEIFTLKLKNLIQLLKGYVDIYKDKLIYVIPVNIKLYKLKTRYMKLGLMKKN